MGKSAVQYSKWVKDGACLALFKVSQRKLASDRFPVSIQSGFGCYYKIQERKFWTSFPLISVPASNDVLA